MAEHIDKGISAENRAVQFLENKGFQILERNWRSGHKEVDIIAIDREDLVFVEVKFRRTLGNERLEEHFKKSKQLNLIRSARAYQEYKYLRQNVRFDIILVVGEPLNPENPRDKIDLGDSRIEHIKDAFSVWDLNEYL
jgi:putative endonuclease